MIRHPLARGTIGQRTLLWSQYEDISRKPKNAEHCVIFDLRSELWNGSHSGHRLGCSDYNKCSVGRSDLRRDYSSHSLNLVVRR